MIDKEFEDYQDDEELGPSKSQVKRDMHAIQDLGEELVLLTPKERAKLPLPDELVSAIAVAVKILKKKDAYRRQIQYIGKIMRGMELEPIQRALDTLRNKHNEQNKLMHQVEQWRDKVIASPDSVIGELKSLYPEIEIQRLRQMARQCKKEQEQNKPPKAYRELFQYLKGFIYPN